MLYLICAKRKHTNCILYAPEYIAYSIWQTYGKFVSLYGRNSFTNFWQSISTRSSASRFRPMEYVFHLIDQYHRGVAVHCFLTQTHI